MTIGSWRHMRAAALTLALFSGACSTAVLAQNNGGAAASPVSAGPCSAIAPSAPDQKRDASLIVACARKGFDLGPVERYELINNALLKTALVDTEIAGLRRLWLITLDDEGVPFLEDATGLLARQAGRGTRNDLTGLVIDLTGFALTGRIRIAPAGTSLEDISRGVGETLDVAENVALARSRRRAAKSASASVPGAGA